MKTLNSPRRTYYIRANGTHPDKGDAVLEDQIRSGSSQTAFHAFEEEANGNGWTIHRPAYCEPHPLH